MVSTVKVMEHISKQTFRGCLQQNSSQQARVCEQDATPSAVSKSFQRMRDNSQSPVLEYVFSLPVQ